MRALIAFSVALLVAGITSAQTATPTPTATRTPSGRDTSDCGNGLPCGPIPWQLPAFPMLQSPTPFSELAAEPPDATPTPTATIPNVDFPELDLSGINDVMITAQYIAEATEQAVYLDGTPVNLDTVGGLTSGGETFFSYLKGFSSATFGPFAGLVGTFLIFLALLLFMVITRMTLFLLTTIIKIIGWLIDKVLEFIPG